MRINSATSDVTVLNSSFIDNQSDLNAGAIRLYDGDLTIANSTFAGNSVGGLPAVSSGAITTSFGATLSILNSTCSGNSSSGNSGSDGGAIYSAGTTTLTNSTFTGNHARNYGDAVYASVISTLTVEKTSLRGIAATAVRTTSINAGRPGSSGRSTSARSKRRAPSSPSTILAMATMAISVRAT